ncbi:TlpA family protein disulfide reductase [Candidatus Pelagibacter sp.]|nr:TlpA family protein disulfide reductase [Candidatus Pelagibacter sp.]
MRLLTIFIFLITNSFAEEVFDIKNLIINKELKKYDNLSFLDDKNNQIYLDDLNGNLILLNFWATWCAPCKEEMPSLDNLQSNKDLNNLKIFPINIGKDNLKKALEFFEDLEIKNLNIYFDNPLTLAKTFSLRGVPTSILINKDGYEFARIMGSIDFNDKNFIKWLTAYN